MAGRDIQEPSSDLVSGWDCNILVPTGLPGYLRTSGLLLSVRYQTSGVVYPSGKVNQAPAALVQKIQAQEMLTHLIILLESAAWFSNFQQSKLPPIPLASRFDTACAAFYDRQGSPVISIA